MDFGGHHKGGPRLTAKRGILAQAAVTGICSAWFVAPDARRALCLGLKCGLRSWAKAGIVADFRCGVEQSGSSSGS